MTEIVQVQSSGSLNFFFIVLLGISTKSLKTFTAENGDLLNFFHEGMKPPALQYGQLP